MSRREQVDYWSGLAGIDPEAAVIDPRDRRGLKNRYLAQSRDLELAGSLDRQSLSTGIVVDLGCGTGSATRALLDRGLDVVGLDIAAPLLKHARERCGGDRALFVLTDGSCVPLASGAADAAVIYVVLSYVTDDESVVRLLAELRRVLRPGAMLSLIEQVRRRRTLVESGRKVQRTRSEWRGLLERAGFRVVRDRIIRHGRFPATPAIATGLVPPL